jgi:ankyrin repeat protein
MFFNHKSIELDLRIAASKGNLEQVKSILSVYGNSININSLDYEKQSALHLACESNKLDVVICLVEHGAKVNILGLGNSTPLHAAALFADTDIISYLLKNGADPYLKNKDSDTPIDYAERERQPEISDCMRGSVNFTQFLLRYQNN